jgi:hypothetical protein
MSEELTLIKGEIASLEGLIRKIKKRRTEERLNQYVHSLLNIKENLIRLKRKLRRLPEATQDEAEEKLEAADLVKEMLEDIKQRELGVEDVTTQTLDEDVAVLRSIFSEISGSLPIEQIMFLVDFSCFPQQIREETEIDFDEVRRCYSAEAFRSAIGTCGRILELFLARRYFESKGVDPIQEKWLIGTLLKKCSEEGVVTEPHLLDISNLINRTRIDSVHSTHRIFKPSPEEAKSIVEFTIGLGKRLFAQNV